MEYWVLSFPAPEVSVTHLGDAGWARAPGDDSEGTEMRWATVGLWPRSPGWRVRRRRGGDEQPGEQGGEGDDGEGEARGVRAWATAVARGEAAGEEDDAEAGAEGGAGDARAGAAATA